MNRSILIVICDFLLVSLLAFSTVDINKVADEGTPIVQKPRLEIAPKTTPPPESGHDLTAVMKQALDEERKNRELLLSELAHAQDKLNQTQDTLNQTKDTLTQTRDTLSQTQEKLENQRAALSEREREVQQYTQQLQSREQEAQRLQQAQAGLQDRFAETQSTLSNLTQQLQATTTDAVISRERLAMIEAEAKKQREHAAELERQLGYLQQSNQVVLSEKQRLTGQLMVAEVERRHATEQAVKLEQQVQVERQEKAQLVQQTGQLAEGVKALASRSGELTQEIRENRALAPNTIYQQFLTNRVKVHLTALRTVVLGIDASRRRDSQTVLVGSGTNIYALLHVEDTPLTLWDPGTDWEGLTGTFTRGAEAVPVHSLMFALRDPRVVLIPVTEAEAHQLGVAVYPVSTEPYKFQDAVLVGQAGYYGECSFQIDASTPGYVRLDNSFIKGLFGKFNASRGDLVFSKNGELLGIMANSTYCLMLTDFYGAASLRFAPNLRDQRTSLILSQLYASVKSLPGKLQ